MTTTETLLAAIEQSIRQNEIVHIEVDAAFDLEPTIGQLFDGDIDFVELTDREVEVWGYDDDTPDNQSLWRLRITLSADALEDDDRVHQNGEW